MEKNRKIIRELQELYDNNSLNEKEEWAILEAIELIGSKEDLLW